MRERVFLLSAANRQQIAGPLLPNDIGYPSGSATAQKFQAISTSVPNLASIVFWKRNRTILQAC
jgi:hypothetical protein